VFPPPHSKTPGADRAPSVANPCGLNLPGAVCGSVNPRGDRPIRDDFGGSVTLVPTVAGAKSVHIRVTRRAYRRRPFDEDRLYAKFTAKSQHDKGFITGLAGHPERGVRPHHRGFDGCTSSAAQLSRSQRELTIVANASGATVVFLQSHPVWAAAQRRERERREAMRRNPSFLAKRAAAQSGDSQALSAATGCAPAPQHRAGRPRLVAIDTVAKTR
jgi:hypothetical protein